MAAVSTAESVIGATGKAHQFLPVHEKPQEKSEQKVKQKLTPRSRQKSTNLLTYPTSLCLHNILRPHKTKKKEKIHHRS